MVLVEVIAVVVVVFWWYFCGFLTVWLWFCNGFAKTPQCCRVPVISCVFSTISWRSLDLFPIVSSLFSQWFPCGLPIGSLMVSLWLSGGSLMGSPMGSLMIPWWFPWWFPCRVQGFFFRFHNDFPMFWLWFPSGFLVGSSWWFPYASPVASSWLSYGIAFVLLWFPYGLPTCSYGSPMPKKIERERERER